MDFLSIALAELGVSQRGEPICLFPDKEDCLLSLLQIRLNSGFMIPQYTAASIVSQNKQLCMPASVDSIVSSNGQEDHVSMGANAATKLFRVVDNVYSILAIELFSASQALEFRRPAKVLIWLKIFCRRFPKGSQICGGRSGDVYGYAGSEGISGSVLTSAVVLIDQLNIWFEFQPECKSGAWNRVLSDKE